MNCPKCGEECERDSVDVGVGVIYGPYGCICGWSEDSRYDASAGESPAQAEMPEWLVDSRGGVIRRKKVEDRLLHFGIPPDVLEPTVSAATEQPLRIEAAAIRDIDGKVWSVPPPGRHPDVIRLMRESGYAGPVSGNDLQGFLLSNGKFCRRIPAMRVARKAGQLKGGKSIASVLTSEDLW